MSGRESPWNFFPTKNSVPSFFGCWAKKSPAFVEKLQAVLSEKLVELPEDFLEVKFFFFKIELCFLNLQQKLSKVWNNCFRNVCQNCSVKFIELFHEEIYFGWKNQLSLFFGIGEEIYGISGKKNLELFGKIFTRVEKTTFRFTEKNVRVNRIMFWKEISFNEIIRPEQKIQIFYRSPFSVLLSEDYASFLEEVWRQNFFVKKVFFLFLFHQTVLGPLRKYFLQWC